MIIRWRALASQLQQHQPPVDRSSEGNQSISWKRWASEQDSIQYETGLSLKRDEGFIPNRKWQDKENGVNMSLSVYWAQHQAEEKMESGFLDAMFSDN